MYDSRQVIHAEGSVNIQASPEQVFALICDVRRCAEINPRIAVINITADPPGPVREGTVFYNRIVVEGRMIEYSSKVLTFAPEREIEIRTDSYPVVNIRYKVEPIAEGARLDQALTSSAQREEPVSVALPGWFGKLATMFGANADDAAQMDRQRQQEQAMAQRELQSQLDEWLTIVKKYLETQQNKLLA